jgi:RNA polymerase sigma-70 factor (ECF subfamily)
VSGQTSPAYDPAAALLTAYDSTLPYVYGYLLPRCGEQALAEDLTSETLLAAVDAVRRNQAPAISTAWLIGIARHKLVDHWRRQAREERGLRSVARDEPTSEDPWEAQLDALRAHAALAALGPHHRAALTLRYLDDLPVVEVALLLDRGIHATEGLLVRARAAFRRAYDAQEDSDG